MELAPLLRHFDVVAGAFGRCFLWPPVLPNTDRARHERDAGEPAPGERLLAEHEPATTNHYLYRLCRSVVSAAGLVDSAANATADITVDVAACVALAMTASAKNSSHASQSPDRRTRLSSS